MSPAASSSSPSFFFVVVLHQGNLVDILLAHAGHHREGVVHVFCLFFFSVVVVAVVHQCYLVDLLLAHPSHHCKRVITSHLLLRFMHLMRGTGPSMHYRSFCRTAAGFFLWLIPLHIYVARSSCCTFPASVLLRGLVPAGFPSSDAASQ